MGQKWWSRSMQVRGIVKEQRMMSETARLRMKMFLVLAGTLLMIDEMMMKLFPRKPITAKEAYKMRNEKYQQFVNLQVSRQQTRFVLWTPTFQSQKWLYNHKCLSVSLSVNQSAKTLYSLKSSSFFIKSHKMKVEGWWMKDKEWKGNFDLWQTDGQLCIYCL